MENYIVSARKYRPLVFQDVVGQQHITDTLEKSITNNHLAQALLFCGPRGVGKTTCARIVARKINEASGGDPDQDYSFNIFELDAASNNSVDDIRNLIDQVRFAPQVGTHKVYIIDEVHMLSSQAFNAFLKTLEEPPAHAIFILATTEKHKIIPTILSRCQIFDFKRIGVDDIAKHLLYVAGKENITADPNALHLIAQKADGALRDSLSIFDRIASYGDNNISYKDVLENLNILDYDYFFKTVDFALQNNPAGLYLLFNEILNQGFDGHLFINGLAGHVRDLMMCKDPATVKLLEVTDEIKAKYLEQSKSCNLFQIFGWLKILNDADQRYKTSANQRLLVEVALSQMTQHFKDAVAALEKKKPEPVAKIPPAQTVKPTVPIINKPNPAPPIPIPLPNTSVAPEESKPTEEKPTLHPKTPQPVTQPLAVKPKRKGVKKFSISSLNNEEEQKQKVADSEEEYVNYGNEKIDETTILKAWDQFANTKKEDKRIYAVLNKTPLFKEPAELFISLESASQENILQEIKHELLKYLRSTLKNSSIDIKHEIKAGKQVKMVYTPEEKFKYMAEKNPALINLKKRLDLHL